MAMVLGNKLFNSNKASFLNNINIEPLTLKKTELKLNKRTTINEQLTNEPDTETDYWILISFTNGNVAQADKQYYTYLFIRIQPYFFSIYITCSWHIFTLHICIRALFQKKSLYKFMVLPCRETYLVLSHDRWSRAAPTDEEAQDEAERQLLLSVASRARRGYGGSRLYGLLLLIHSLTWNWNGPTRKKGTEGSTNDNKITAIENWLIKRQNNNR